MADIGRPPALAGADPVAALGESRRAGELAFGELEAERAGSGIGLDQLQLEMLADAVSFAAVSPTSARAASS